MTSRFVCLNALLQMLHASLFCRFWWNLFFSQEFLFSNGPWSHHLHDYIVVVFRRSFSKGGVKNTLGFVIFFKSISIFISTIIISLFMFIFTEIFIYIKIFPVLKSILESSMLHVIIFSFFIATLFKILSFLLHLRLDVWSCL